jgi:putative endonuclease
MAPRRQEALARGRAAEWMAALLLAAKGYRILARSFRVSGGELDIVALSPLWQKRTVVFVEVRARGTIEAAAESVTATKRKHVAWAASQFCARRRRLTEIPWRFDLILVAPGRWPQHVADVWSPASR